MKPTDEIRAMFEERHEALGPVHARGAELTQTYNGEVMVPLPELDENEKPAIANLVQSGLDHYGMRIASTMPSMFWPPLRPGIKASEAKARKRHLATLGFHETNRLPLKLRRRARWLVGYASAPVVIRPDNKLRIPRWNLRNPMSTYPAPTLDPDELHPPDAIFAYRRGREWLAKHFPDQFRRLRRLEATKTFTMLEYADDEEWVVLILGDTDEPQPEPMFGRAPTIINGEPEVELYRLPNRAGIPPTVVPGRVTLDRPQGQFDGILGIFQMQAKLMALNVIATQRSIFREQWLVSNEGENPQVIAMPNPEEGEIGQVSGGKIETVVMDPGVFANPLMDRLEYAERHTAGIPAQFGGQGPTNVRTGRALDSVMAAVIDFPVQEAQQLFEFSLKKENEIAHLIQKHHFGSEPKSFYISGVRENVDYTPNVDFETTNHEVSYAYAGADANAMNIITGQKVAMKALSRRSVMEIDPLIPDVEKEWDRITGEGLFDAFMASIQTQAADPNGPYQPDDMARLYELVVSNKKELFEAVHQLQQEVQERQAEAQAGAEMQPGLAQPGAPGVPAPVEEPEPSLANLGNLMSRLRQPQMRIASEKRGA